MMNCLRNTVTILLTGFLSICSLNSQVFLQLERPNIPQSKKFVAGDILEYQVSQYPGVWKKHIIVDLKADAQIIALDDQFFHTSDFSYLRFWHPGVVKLGDGILTFSAGWYLFGGIATAAAPNYTMSKREIIIGASFTAVGLLLRTLFKKSKLRLGNKHRLRVMDTRMSPGKGF